MKPQTEAPFSDCEVHTEDGVECISKTRLKLNSKSLQNLGKKLCTYNDDQLARIPLGEKILEAISLAHKLSNKRSALKRHYQYIGKLLRSIEAGPVVQAVEALEDASRFNKQAFKQSEYWRDRILEQGDKAIFECCQQYPYMERQDIRQLWRNHHLASCDEKKNRFARLLFKKIHAGLI